MYEKNFISRIIFYIFIIIAGSGIFTSCKSTQISDSDTISRNSYATGQLEATIAELDRTTTDSRNRITGIISTSRNIENGIERIEYLFGEYESEVDRLLNEIDKIRIEIEKTTKSTDILVDNSRNNNNNQSNITMAKNQTEN